MQPTLYLFVGYPGAGKTTVSRIIEELTGAVHLWADKRRQAMFDHPTHKRSESKQLYDTLNAEAEQLLNQGKSVIFDTNFNFYDDRQLLRELATKQGAKTVIVWITTPRTIAKQRAVYADETRNGYETNMPESDFTRMARNLQPPRDSEQAVEIIGVDVTPVIVKQALSL